MFQLIKMMPTLSILAQRLRRDSGAVTIEYGVVVVFIALMLTGAAAILVLGVETWFGNISTAISSMLPGGGEE